MYVYLCQAERRRNSNPTCVVGSHNQIGPLHGICVSNIRRESPPQAAQQV